MHIATAGGGSRGLPPLVRTDSGRGFAWAAAGSVSRAVGSAAARSDAAAVRLLQRWRRVARAAAAGPHGQRPRLCNCRGGLSEARGGQRSCQERRRCCASVATAGGALGGLPLLVRTESGRGLARAAAGSVSRAVGSAAARSDAAAARLLRQRAARWAPLLQQQAAHCTGWCGLRHTRCWRRGASRRAPPTTWWRAARCCGAQGGCLGRAAGLRALATGGSAARAAAAAAAALLSRYFARFVLRPRPPDVLCKSAGGARRGLGDRHVGRHADPASTGRARRRVGRAFG